MNKDLQGLSPSKSNAGETQGINSYINSLKKKNEVSFMDSPGPDMLPVKENKTIQPKSLFKNEIKNKTFSPNQKDKIYRYEKENEALKMKENLLESEILKMKTKLRRIDELFKKKRDREGDQDILLPSEISKHFEDEIKKLRDENNSIKDQTNKLKAIERELNSKHVTNKVPKGKYAHVRGKLTSGRLKKGEQEYENLIGDLKIQLVNGEKQIIQLTTQRDQLQMRFPSENSGRFQFDDQQKELSELMRRISDIRSNLIRDESMFSDSKDYVLKKQQEIEEISRECEQLAHQNFQINLKAQQAKELSEDLDNLRLERDQLEKSITQITSYPFLKNKSGELSIAQQVEKLQISLREAEKQCQDAKFDEEQKQNQIYETKQKIERLKGELDLTKKQHGDAKQKYTQSQGNISAGDVYRDLFNIDKEKHALAVSDMQIQPDNYPLWKNLDFLERDKDDLINQPNDVKQLKQEIQKIKHENKDFAAELDKAQSLLRLQTDIERENRQYFEQEKERIKILAQSNSIKTQEMEKKIEAQLKLLSEIKQSLGMEQKTPLKDAQKLNLFKNQFDTSDVHSDFSEDSQESKGKDDENILDVRIIESTFDSDIIDHILNQQNKFQKNHIELMTIVSLDFYNHETRTSQLCQGKNPKYDSQISFKNKMDWVYVQHLLNEKQKFEVWLCDSGKKALLLGSCETLLSELVFKEKSISDSLKHKTAVIEKQLKIMPTSALLQQLQLKQQKPLGQLKVKMRLRRPITEAMRFHRDLNEAKNQTRDKKVSLYEEKIQLITIQVLECFDLKVSYGDSSRISPFFYYQFYTFKEHYSQDSVGSNPKFDDIQKYEVKLDDGSLKYFEQQNLEIAFLDNNAPINGLQKGGQSSNQQDQVDDLIGIAKISLKEVALGAGIDKKFNIINLKQQVTGQVKVKITITEPQQQEIKLLNKEQDSINLKLQNELIEKIAKKLCKRNIDVELMFGIFSRGSRLCSFEDFKYCCMQRLNLKQEMKEKDLDLFLSTHKLLKGKKVIELSDFKEIFQQPIVIARQRNELEKEQDDMAQLLKYSSLMQQREQEKQKSAFESIISKHQFPLSQSNNTEALSMNEFQRQHATKILIKAILESSVEELSREVLQSSSNDRVKIDDIRRILHDFGGASDNDTLVVTNLISANGVIFAHNFIALLKEAQLEARFSNLSLPKFDNIVQQQPQMLAEIFLRSDINNDGDINIDGFTSSLIEALGVTEYGLTLKEIQQIFKLLSDKGKFNYAEYMIDRDNANHQFFTRLNLPNESQRYIESSHATMFDHSKSNENILETSHHSAKKEQTLLRNQHSSSQIVFHPIGKSLPALQAAKEKIQQFLVSQDVTLAMLFNVIDTNSDNQLSKAEFKQKLRALHLNLEEEELESLFRYLDADKDGCVSYKEFIEQFSAANTAQIISRMKRILYGAQMSVEQLIDQHREGERITRNELRKVVKTLIDSLQDFEIDSVFKELDRNNLGSIPVDEFVQKFGKEQQEKQFQSSIEDIFQPLKYHMLQKGITVSEIFNKYDQNKNQMLSAKELKQAFYDLIKYPMSPEEVNTIHEYFRAKFKRGEIKKTELQGIIQTEFKRQYDTKAAKSAIHTLKKKLSDNGRSIQNIIQNAQTNLQDLVTSRSFKQAVFAIGCLTPHQVNNMAKYLDKSNNGMLSISEILSAFQ